ncbi:TPM domain-containing protein [Avibacterium paragallinarum]|uniref:TPM domain-containing protein n=1 Tax=Avibacterium paragallinarum TaxID=728 RepID=UPI0006150A4E|nr:TPM domain-containing protein [Avibacterium paragallinarum]QIR11339.1 methanol dehydrogenase [Avibacterium paragallinarum]QJE09841.1 methanol dehydrogenase [Avibacterium paragallinarum]QJE12037.1 methanol dehydrogenase [Avibacterium paragallinarum]QJE14238.1 methanol dehydrogenase [Avibacterium paragallinarum]QJE16438.1 methanol dehydrogenase [Avibacterium paragallinarum]
MIKRMKSAVIFFFVFFSFSLSAANFPPPPNPFHYVNDYTNTLMPSEKQLLENKLIAYSKETSSQIAVVLIPSTGNYDIAQYSFELGDKWGIGRKQLNNGVLMLIAVKDRKIFIATGQGLAGALPDAFLSQIIRNVITPAFKKGQYMLGIDRGLDYIIAASKGEYEAAKQDGEGLAQYIPLLMIAAFVLIVLLGELGGRRTPYISPINPNRTSTFNRRNGGGGFGGFGGGSGFGGSSGGGFGGGGFGGGGAGGSW